MADSLAASFFSSNQDRNLALPGDTVTFSFTSPPPAASNVLVSVVETVAFLDTAKSVITDRPVGGFKGDIVKGVFQVQSVLGAPLPPFPDPVLIRVAASFDPASPHVFAHMPEPETVLSHSLRLRVQGTVAGKAETFEGASRVQMEYPIAMVVATRPARASDPSFAVVDSWSQGQWLAHKPKFRHVEHIRAVRFTRAIVPNDYDELIAACVTCAGKAKSGVVALAVGHGDAGQTQPNGVPWCNLVPEDFAPPIGSAPFLYNLDIDDTVLGEGAPPPGNVKPLLSNTTRIKLNAIDRMADALAGTGIRRILLHTCKAGGNRRFMQLFADRLRVPLLAHTAAIEYTGVAGSGTITAEYEGDKPLVPRDLRHWPISKAAGPFFPSAIRPNKVSAP